MIGSFKTRGESNFKSGEVVDIEEALWYIATTTNYTYSDLSAENEKTWVDTCLINIALTNNKVSLTEVYAKYELLIENLRAFYGAKNEENKQFLTVSIEPVSREGNNLLCKARAVFTYSPITGGYFNFDNSTSYSFWYYWQYNATCDIQSPLVTDAANETQIRIMRSKGTLPIYYYYEPVASIPIDNPLDYPIDSSAPNPHNNRFSHLYWNSSQYPNFNGCIPPDDLNFYLIKTKELINNEVGNGGIRPAGTGMIDIYMNGIIKTVNANSIFCHQATVNYGILRQRPDPRYNLE